MTHAQDRHGSASRRPRRLPLDSAERKKLLVVVILAAVCAGVVLVQLWRKKGPTPAQASTGATATAPVNLDEVIRQMRMALHQPLGGKHATFTTVDEALELFLSGTRTSAVPVEQLRPMVFGLPELDGAKTTPPDADLAAAEQAAADGDPTTAALDKLQLETVLVSVRNRAAIINGQVLHCGETIDGFKVTAIEPGRVTLARDGKRFALTLK